MKRLIFYFAVATTVNLTAQNKFAYVNESQTTKHIPSSNRVNTDDDAPMHMSASKDFPYDFELQSKAPCNNASTSLQNNDNTEEITVRIVDDNEDTPFSLYRVKKEFPYDFEVQQKTNFAENETVDPHLNLNWMNDYDFFSATAQPTFAELFQLVKKVRRVSSYTPKNETPR